MCEYGYLYEFPLPFMVVGLRDEARNRKCAVSQTLVSCHVSAHDKAFGGLDSSASAERTLALLSRCNLQSSRDLEDTTSATRRDRQMKMLASRPFSRTRESIYVDNS